NAAYCPEKEIKDNPILQISKLIIFPRADRIEIKRSSKFGGNLKFDIYENLEKVYLKGNLHPMDLKNSVIEQLEKIIAPIRKNYK
ncbi:MAG: tyrosine--tRNA ligase, partial [Nanoarchaeota archaeon]